MDDKKRLRVLLLEDSADDALLALEALERAGYVVEVRHAKTRQEFLACLDPELDLILSDHSLPQFDAPSALDLMKAQGLDVPFIIVSGTISEELAVETLKRGAADYLLKDRLARLGPAVAHALEEHSLRQERERAAEALRRSEALNRAVLRSLPTAIVVLDGGGGLVSVNEAWWAFARDMAGSGLFDARVGETYLDLCRRCAGAGATPVKLVAQGIASVLEGSEASFSLEYCLEPGAARWFWLQVTPLEDRAGGAVLALHDITERKLAEETLRRYADRLERLHELDQAMLKAPSSETVAGAALLHLRRLIPCDRTTAVLFDVEQEEAVVLAGWAASPEFALQPGMRGPLDDPLDGGSLVEEAFAGVMKGGRDVPALLTRLGKDALSSMLRIPLIVQNTVIGELYLEATSAEAFSHDHHEVAWDVASSLSLALQSMRLFERLQQAHERLEEMSRRLVGIQEEERRRIALELHDEIGQSLTAIRLAVAAAEDAANAPSELVRKSLARAQDLTGQLTAKVRSLSLDLRPTALDDLGLLPALLDHFKRYAEQTSVLVHFEHAGLSAQRFSPEVETAAYRIVQEALTNIARHAGVGEARVTAWAQEGHLHLSVEDEGPGFDPVPILHAHRTGGLSGMRERAALVGGRLSIEAGPGRGASLSATLPLAPADPSAGHTYRGEKDRGGSTRLPSPVPPAGSSGRGIEANRSDAS